VTIEEQNPHNSAAPESFIFAQPSPTLRSWNPMSIKQVLALLKQRCKNDGLDVSSDTLNRQLRLHLHRGIGYMAVHGFIKGIDDLVRLTKEA